MPSASTSAAGESAVERPFVMDGCAATVSLDGPAEQVLERLQAACAPNTTAQNPEPATLKPSADKPVEARLELDSDAACIRVAAFSSDPGADLTLAAKDSTGQVLGEDSLAGPVALLEKDGPICLRKAGALTLSVGVKRGQTTAVLRAWRPR